MGFMFNIDIIQLFYDIDNLCQELKQKTSNELLKPEKVDN
jgi:hypothetical protein